MMGNQTEERAIPWERERRGGWGGREGEKRGRRQEGGRGKGREKDRERDFLASYA